MPTEACEIDRRIVNKAEKMAKAGLNGTHTFKDYGKLGLHLRVRGHRAVWLTKYKQYTRTIGQLHPQPAERPITSVKTARETAANIRAVLKSQPEKFDDYMAHRDNGHTHENAVAKLIEVPDGWTLRECFDATLQDKLSENSKKKIGAATERDIRYILSLRTWGETLDQPTTRLTQGDLETVRNATHKAHGVSASLKLVSYTREALTWCAKHHNGASGLSHAGRWWTTLSSPHVVQARTRMPCLDQAVRTLWIAEQFLDKPLPNRQCNKNGVAPETLAALWWAVLTCQRTGAGFSLLKSDLVKDAHAPEKWWLASWDAANMKGKRRVILPVPVQAIDHLNRFLRMSKHFDESPVFLPSAQNLNLNVTGSGAYQILSRLAGKNRNKSQTKSRQSREKKPWPNLLAEEGIDWWAPHDIRRSISEFLSEADYPGGASAILAHTINDPTILDFNKSDQRVFDRMKQSPADVTKKSYGAHSAYMELKKDAMDLWIKAVLEAYERQKSIGWRGETLKQMIKP